MNIVIVINGTGGSGKDTVILNCKKYLLNKNILVGNYSTVDVIKEIARNYVNWDNSKTERNRKFISDLKKVCKQYNNMPFNDVVNSINSTKTNPENKVFFIHSREPEEIQEFIDHFNKDEHVEFVKTLLVKRKDHIITSNDSDKNVENFKYDYIILNDTDLDELNTKCKKLSKELIEYF